MVEAGVELPDGTKLRMVMNGVAHEGEIADGAWIVEGKRVNSASGAAKTVAKTKNGKAANVDGWRYWRALRPGDTEYRLLFDLWAGAHRA